MNLKKLSNKTLVRFINELRGLMDFYLERDQAVEYETAQKLYNEANQELLERLPMAVTKTPVHNR